MLIQDRDQFNKARTILLEASTVALDTETHTIEKNQSPRMIGFSAYCQGPKGMMFGFYIPFRHTHSNLLSTTHNLPEEWIKDLKPFFDRTDCWHIYHNAKFDLRVFRQEGLEIKAPFYDTQIIAHMRDENELTKKLKRLGDKYLSKDSSKEEKDLKQALKFVDNQHANIDPIIMERYAVQDVKLTWDLFEFLWNGPGGIVDQSLDSLWEREMTYIRALSLMEDRGVGLDIKRAKELAYESQSRMQEIQDELGFDPAKSTQLARRLFGAEPPSLAFQPQELSKNKLDPPLVLTSGKKLYRVPVMDEDALSSFHHPTVDLVLEYRGHMKALSTWFEGFLDAVWPDQRLHPSFRPDGAKTGRTTCAEPNLMQLPRRSDAPEDQQKVRHMVKSMLRAEPGHELWEYDYSQQEFRLAVCYGQDEKAIEAYRSGADMHQLTADSLGIDRFPAKTLNFALMYGAGYKKIAKMLDIPDDEARELVSKFWETYPGLKKIKDYATSQADKNKYVQLYTGRRRHFLWPSEHHKAMNSIIQGGGSEMIKTAINTLYTDHPEIQVVCTVYDSLWVEHPTEKREEEGEAVKKVMAWPNDVDDFVVPFVVDEKRLA